MTTVETPAPVRVALWLPSLFTLAGTLAMHIFVPALPAAGADLGASNSAMQLTVSLYMVGMAFGQLIYGPLSDRFGRRPVLMAALGLYVAAGFVAAIATAVEALVVARLFQALGGSAGLVLGRAIVRDAAEGTEAARRMALMNLLITIGPGIAPIVGGAMNASLGWRSILFLICALGVMTFLCVWRLLPETMMRPAGGQGSLRRNYASLLRSRAFLGFAFGGSCATTSMYAFIASAPFIYVEQLHRPPIEVGFYLCFMIAGVWLGSILVRQLLKRRPAGTLMIQANALSLLSALVWLLAILAGQLTVPVTVGALFLFTLGAGIASPLALTQAVSVNPHVIGSASGLYGFTQMLLGAGCTVLAGLGNDPALATAIVLTAASVAAQFALRGALRQQHAAP